MCLDPTIFFTILSNLSAFEIVGGALLGLVLVSLAIYLDNRSQLQRSRMLRQYRQDVYQLQQEAAQKRKIAADECLLDVYRLTTRRR